MTTADTPRTLTEALAAAQAGGREHLDAQLLLLHALGRDAADRAWLIAHDRDPLPAAAQAHFVELCARRRSGAPIAYLTGWRGFYGLKLQVDKRVLDPRPDTETLVDWALEYLPENTPRRVLDLGTGSGAIALALASTRPLVDVWASDASADALVVARANATRLGLRVHFVHGDWCAAVPDERFDLIVSNPPYIAAGDPHLRALVAEPHAALVSGADGLDAIRTLSAQAPGHLTRGGWLLLEHGWDQAKRVRTLLQAHGYVDVQSRRDLAGMERCSGGRWPAGNSGG